MASSQLPLAKIDFAPECLEVCKRSQCPMDILEEDAAFRLARDTATLAESTVQIRNAEISCTGPTPEKFGRLTCEAHVRIWMQGSNEDNLGS